MIFKKSLRAASLFTAISIGAASPVALTGMENVSSTRPVAPQLSNGFPPGETVVGAFPAPPAGSGPGTLAVWQPDRGIMRTVSFGTPESTSGNSFYVAADQASHTVFVPTVAGITYVVSTKSWTVVGQFSSLSGGRVAKVTPDGQLLIVESGKTTSAYQTTAPYHKVFSDSSVGGNALVVAPNGRAAFVGGNADKNITEIALPTGKTVTSFSVGNSGDMVWARGEIFSADIASGVMSAINPATGKIVPISTPEVDKSFSYNDIPAATAGFMQLAVSPGQRRVYAAGFSGHILAFSTRRDAYLGEVAVKADTATSQPKNLLSGLVVLPGGRQAVVTVENLNESVVVSLQTGMILSSATSLASNRWITLR